MGDRLLIQVIETREGPPDSGPMFADKAVVDIAPCAAYSHWGGEEGLDTLREAVPRMRKNDCAYSTARLIAHMCGKNPVSNTGIGVMDATDQIPPESDYSHGDAGVIVYDCSTGKAQCFHGYLADEHPDPIDIGLPPT